MKNITLLSAKNKMTRSSYLHNPIISASKIMKNTFAKLCLFVLTFGLIGEMMGQTIYTWNCTTASATSGSNANITMGSFTNGNSNGAVTLISSTSSSSGYTGATGTSNFGVAANIGALNIGTSAYFTVTITPASGYTLSINSISLGSRSTGTGPALLSLRTNVDSYASTIASSSLSTSSNWALVSPTISGSAATGTAGSPITLRIYGSGGTGSPSASTANWRIDDISLSITATSSAATPTLTTTTVSSITNTTVTLGASIATSSGSNVTAKGVYVGTSATPRSGGNGATSLNVSSFPDVYTYGVTGLSAQTAYFFAGYATNSTGTGYSTDGTFRTLSNPPTAQPTSFSTIPANTSLTANWNTATFPGSGATNTGYLVIYSTSTPTLSSANGAAPAAGVGILVNITSGATLATTINGLTNGTTYNLLLIPYTWDGANTTTYSYLTASARTTTGVPSTTPTVTTTTISGTAPFSATSGGNVTADGGSLVTARGILWGTSSPLSITQAPARTSSNGTGTGTFTSYLAALKPSTTYYYGAYATNANGTVYGSELSFTTSAQTGSQMAFWNFGPNATGYTNTVTAETVVGTPTITLTDGTIDTDGKDGVAYTDINGTSQARGQAAGWDDINTSSAADIIFETSTVGFKDIYIKFDYKSQSAINYDVDYRLNGGSWISIINNGTILANRVGNDYNWNTLLLDLSAVSAIEDYTGAGLVEIRINDFDASGGNDEFIFDNFEVIGTSTSKTDQTISGLPATDSKTYGDAAYSLSATASSGLTVTYASSNTSVATISGNTVTIVAPGTTTITASQAGDASYNAAPNVTQTLTVSVKTLTITGASGTNKTYDGNNTAAITGGTLQGIVGLDVVTFSGGGTFASFNVGTGIAITTSLTLGGADAAKYTLTQPSGLTADITKANQTITFGTLANKTTADVPYALTGTSSSGLSLTYISSNTSVATISGSTVTIVGAGTTNITASQAGNTNYNAASDVVRSLNVTSASEINVKQSTTNYLTASTYTYASAASGTTNDITFTIENLGTSNLTFSTPVVAGTGFSLQSPPTSPISGPSGTSTFIVRFSPTTPGSYTGSITIANNDADESSYVINLSGTGTPNAVSDIIATSGYSYNSNIDYTAYQIATITNTSNSISIFQFDIRDGGGAADADALPTILSGITFNLTNLSNIRTAALFNGNALVNAAPTINTGAGTIAFSGLSGANVTAADGGTNSLTLRVSFLSTVTDNAQFQVTIANANVTAAGSNTSSTFSAFTSVVSSTTTDRNRLEVTADRIAIVQQPSTASVSLAMTPAVTISANDVNGNRDLDSTGNISITSTGTLTGTPVVVACASGLATFSSLTHTVSGTGFTLTATSTGLAVSNTVTSGTFDISSVAANSYRSTGTGTWSGATWERFVSGSWSSSAAPSTSTTNMVYIRHSIGSGGSISPSLITIETGGTLTISSSSTIGSSITVESGGVFQVNAALTNSGTLTIKSGGRMNINFNLTNGVSALWNGTEDFQAGSTVDIQNWDYTAASGDNRLVQNPSIISTNSDGYYFGNLIVSGTPSAIFVISEGSQTINLCKNNFTVSTSVNNVAFTTNASNVTVGGNLIVTAGQLSIASTTSGNPVTTILGNIVPTGGIINLNQNSSGSATSIVQLMGNLSIPSGTTLQSTDAGCKITFAGTTTQTLSIAGTLGTNVDFEIASGATCQLTAQNLALSNASNSMSVLTGGTLDFNGFDISGSGSFTQNSGARLKITSANGVNATGGTGNVQNTGTRTFDQTGIFHYTSSATPQSTGTAMTSGSTAKRIIIEKSSASNIVNLTQSTGTTDSLKIIQGTFVETAASNVIGTGTLAMSGGTYQTAVTASTVPQISGTYSLTGGTLELNAAGNQELRGSKAYNNLTFSNSGTKTISSAISSIAGTVTISGSAILDVVSTTFGGASTNFTMTGGRFRSSKLTNAQPEMDGTYSLSAGTVELYGTSASQQQTLKGGKTYFNVELNSTAANSGQSNVVQGAGNVSVLGTFAVASPTVYEIGGSSSIAGVGNFTLASGAGFKYGDANGIKTSGTGTSDGNIRVSGTRTFPTTASYGFVGSTTQVSGNGLPATVSNLYLSKNASGNTVTLTNDVAINNALELQLGVLNASGKSITFQNGNTPIITTSGTITADASTNLVFGTAGNTGGNAFTIPNNTFTSAPSINNLTINRTNDLSLGNQNLTFNGALTLTAGNLNAAGRTLTFQTSATPISATSGNLIVDGTSSLVFNQETTQTKFVYPEQTFSGDVTLGSLTINRKDSVLLNTKNWTVNGALTLTSGILRARANSTLTLNSSVTATSGSLGVHPWSTVNYAQSTDGQSILASVYGNLTFNNFNKNFGSRTIEVKGNFTSGTATGHTYAGSLFRFTGTADQNAGGMNYDKITINKTGALIANGDTIKVNDLLKIEAGTLTTNNKVKLIGVSNSSYGSLIDASTAANGSVTGNVLVQRIVASRGGTNTNGNGAYYSSPFSDAIYSNYQPTTKNFFIMTNGNWVRPTLTATIPTGIGFTRRAAKFGENLRISGKPNSGTISPSLSTSAGGTVNTIGNPYPSTIDWELISKTNIDGGVAYVFNGSGFQVSGGTWDGKISIAQGFQVKATTGASITFTNACRLETKASFLRVEAAVAKPKLSLHLYSQNEELTDESFLVLNEKATPEFSRAIDAKKFWPTEATNPALGLIKGLDTAVICHLPSKLLSKAIPMVTIVSTSGLHKLTVSGQEYFKGIYDFVVYDAKTGDTYEIADTTTRLYLQVNAKEPSRYYLNLKDASVPVVTEANDPTQLGHLQVYTFDKQLIINNYTNQEVKEVKVISIDGKLLTEGNQSTISLQNAAPGVYIVKVQLTNGFKTFKVVLN